jgi:hypothetical protein
LQERARGCLPVLYVIGIGLVAAGIAVAASGGSNGHLTIGTNHNDNDHLTNPPVPARMAGLEGA